MMDEYIKEHLRFIQNTVNKAAIMAANWRRCRSIRPETIASVLRRNSELIYGSEDHIMHTAAKVAENIGFKTAILEKRTGKTGSSFRKTNDISEIIKFMRHNAAWIEDALGNGGCCWRNRKGEWCGISFE